MKGWTRNLARNGTVCGYSQGTRCRVAYRSMLLIHWRLGSVAPRGKPCSSVKAPTPTHQTNKMHLLGLGLPLAGHGELRRRGRQGLVLGRPVATVREVVLQHCEGCKVRHTSTVRRGRWSSRKMWEGCARSNCTKDLACLHNHTKASRSQSSCDRLRDDVHTVHCVVATKSALPSPR